MRKPHSPALAPYVECMWVFHGELSHGYERLLPTGRVQLLVNLFEDELRDYTTEGQLQNRTAGAGVQGPRVRPFVIDTLEQRASCGVSFAPGGAAPFFREPLSELNEQTVDLRALWVPDGSLLRERVLEAADPAAQLDAIEAALIERAREWPARDQGFELASRMLASGAAVDAVERRLGLSPRQLIERFRTRTGLTPKLYARVERFQRLLRAIDGATSWVELALSEGYADQAHMIREFKAFSGTTPSAYRARAPGDLNHTVLELPQKSSIRRAWPAPYLRDA